MADEFPWLLVDATDGAYMLCGDGVGADAEPDLLDAPEDVVPGDVISAPHMAQVFTLAGGDELDERVRLSVLYADEDPLGTGGATGRVTQSVPGRFHLDARAPVFASSVEGEFQGWVTRHAGHFQCQLVMSRDDEPAAGEPAEFHALHIWPTIASERTINWWTRDLDLSLTSELRHPLPPDGRPGRTRIVR